MPKFIMTPQHMERLKEYLPCAIPPELNRYRVRRDGNEWFSHPFACLPTELFCENTVAVIAHKTEMARVYLAQKDWISYVFNYERPYRLNALLEIEQFASMKERADLVRHVWMDSEWPSTNLSFWVSLFKVSEPLLMMNKLEQKTLNRLPNMIDIYRGVGVNDGKPLRTKKHGLSWTLDKDKATWFAKRFGLEPYVFHANIDKRLVRALFLTRGEREVIIPTLIKFTTERV